jgi:hypothetical protein
MTCFKRLTRRASLVWCSRLMTLVFSGFVLVLMPASIVQAQWTQSGNNINNTNTGSVGIGTASLANGKLVVQTPSGTTPAIARFEQLQTPNDRGGYISFGGGSDGTTAKGYIGFGKAGTGGVTLFANELPNAFGIRSENALHLGTTGNLRMTIDAAGNVGIGLTSPVYSLDVNGGVNSFRAKASTTSSTDTIATFENASGIQAIFRANGNVGIATITPSEKLEVNGNIKVTGTGNINATGTITGGNIVAKYQDVAEWVQSSQALTAGTVVVLDHTKSNQVVASTQAYDTRVAGVISLQPGITLGEGGAGKVLVATTGRVKVKVDATNAPIHIGDLLVTSDNCGFAMKSESVVIGKRQMHAPGTLIGKALEPLATGQGEILVLLSLQ